MLAGASAGAIVCALAATRTDAELAETMKHVHEFDMSFFSCKNMTEVASHLWAHGYSQDERYLQRRLRVLYGYLTFQEAFDRTGRILNVSVTAADTQEPPRLLNYLTAPYVLIWSAVAASSAFPGLFPAMDILAKNVKGEFIRWGGTGSIGRSGESSTDAPRRWRDGSLELDLPLRELGVMVRRYRKSGQV